MRIVFMGTPQAAVPTLERILEDGHEVAAVWTQPDRPAGRGKKMQASPVKEFALAKGIEVFQPEKIKNKSSIARFKSHNADAAVVVAYGRILSKSYLNAFPKGCINVHFSLLPKYRGAAPVNWAIVRGEEKTGVTTMRMDAGLDTGDILLQSETEIGKEENAIELVERLSFMGAELLCETLEKYDEIVSQPQKDEKATFAPLMSKEDGKIDWSKTAKEINDQIRGFQPFPRSFTSFRGEKLTLWKGKAVNNVLGEKSNGEIVKVNSEALFVNCGDNTCLQLLELQLPGKRRMNIKDFLNGIKPQEGEILGA